MGYNETPTKGFDMYVIPIASDSLDLIEVLNNGIRPEIEAEQTFFVYFGPNQIPQIINAETFVELTGEINKIEITRFKS